MSQRAVIIGGGAIGMASAYFLQRTGWDVTVVDRDEMGHGCSYANACLIVPSHSHAIPAPGVIPQAVRWMLQRDSPFYVRPRFDRDFLRWMRLFRRYCTSEAQKRGFHALLALSQLSFDQYETLLREGEVDFFFRRAGLLHVYVSDRGFTGALDEQKELAAAGFEARRLSPDEARAVEPALGKAIAGGLRIEGEAHGHCYGYVHALVERLSRGGARFLAGRAVCRLSLSERRVTGVQLSDGAAEVEELDADLVVLAAGSWSASLVRSLGLDLPLQPAKGYSCTIDAYPGSPKIPILIKEKRVIITPLEKRLRFGGTLELAGFDTRLDPARYGAVVAAARSVLAEPFPLAHEEPWCGLRPVTPDGLPVIGRPREIEGLIVATGHAMLGFTQSPGTGKVVAELANEQAPSIPLEAFRVGRFSG